jgi:hypothetical protein
MEPRDLVAYNAVDFGQAVPGQEAVAPAAPNGGLAASLPAAPAGAKRSAPCWPAGQPRSCG